MPMSEAGWVAASLNHLVVYRFLIKKDMILCSYNRISKRKDLDTTKSCIQALGRV